LHLNNWILRNIERSFTTKIITPGTVFENLIKNKIIKDPFYALNEKKVKWVYESTWEYSTEFNINKEFLNSSDVILEFDGLDTIAEIYLNDELLDSVENMFRTYKYHIKSKLKSSSNILRIVFHSPTDYAKKMIEKYDIKLNTGEEDRAIPGIPYLRKAQYSFGWDWGPILPDIGIWKEVKLIPINTAKIDSVYISQTFEYNENSNEIKSIYLDIEIEIKSYVGNLSSQNVNLIAELKDPNGDIIKKEQLLESLKENIQFKIQNPNLWWTHDLGPQNLYDLNIQLKKEDIIDQNRQKIGLRELTLIRDSDKWGETFYFRLNGVPFFAKGANWIPIDSFIPRGKKIGLYEVNLNYAIDANMNMIRVWGGGIYEDDLFYQLCDKMGILVWQDFPFACALYPIHNGFYENIEKEFRDNIKRLRNHPSLALWCGNNEIEYLWNWLKVSSDISDEKIENKYKKGYIKIFERMLPSLLEILDPNRPYWPSSPSNGFCGMNIGTINSNSPKKGDSHYWSVWHGGKPFKAYSKFDSRFMSEFGFESFPSIKTISEFCPENEFNINSPIMENHQKNDAGNDLIMRYMKRRYSVPENFKKKIILSQITQAEAIEYGVKYWRSQRKEHHCMGTLYWQLNDCWPVTSWSSIDYNGRWKALHYLARRFYQPIIVAANINKKKVEFKIINDSLDGIDGLLNWKILKYNGKNLKEGNITCKLRNLTILDINPIDIKDLCQIEGFQENCILFYNLTNPKNGDNIYRGFKLFINPNNFRLKDSDYNYQVKEDLDDEFPNYEFFIEIISKNISLFTHIDSKSFDFIASDNYFSMEPKELKKIGIKIINYEKFVEKNKISQIKQSFKVYSLSDLIL